MRIRDVAACVLAVTLGASPLVHGAPGSGMGASAEAVWINGFDLAGGADGGALLVVGGWINGYDLPSGSDPSALLVAAGWTNGYDLPIGGDEILNVAVELK